MKMRIRFGIVTTAGLMFALMTLLVVLEKIPSIQAQQNSSQQAQIGQTATKLADGRWLVLGGEGTEQSAAIVDPRTNTSTPLVAGWLPRSGHTATLLANGQVLVVGGRTPSGQLIGSADLVDPETQTVLQIAIEGGTPRAGHTATLLTDGRIVVAGGTTSDQRSAADLELWDMHVLGVTAVTTVESRLSDARTAHSAALLANGRVLLSGGVGSDGQRVSQAEVYDPASGQVVVEPPAEIDPTPVHVTAALPENGAQSVPVDARLALRFSTPLVPETVNANTVSLTGSDGPVQISIVPAEGGRLVFVSPRAALEHVATYTLNIIGAADGNGVPLVTRPITFVTAEKKTDDTDNLSGIDGEAWIPDGESVANGWRSQRPESPWRRLPPLEAPPGVTALAGQVLRLDGRPLANVTLEVEGRTARTNGTGRFLLLLEGLQTSEQELLIDARTASRPERTYGLFETRAKIHAGSTTALPFTIWSPQLDTANQVTIPFPKKAETVITTPLIPGLELHLSAGTAIYDHDGQVARTISITPIPVDRPPFPMPVDAEFPVFFTIQPGGAYIHSYGPSKGAWLVYPNARGAREGKRVQFFHYDPEGNGWYVYGMGTVKGAKVVPDARTRIYEFTGASFNDGNAPPPAGPTPGDDCGKCADPVSLTTGIFTFDATDLYIADVLPIAVTRSYNSRDPEVRPFGRGMSHMYAIFQHSENQLEEADLYLPDGGKIHYVRIPDGGQPWYNAVLEHTATPTVFYKSRVQLVGGFFHLKLKDGTVYVFGHGAPLQAIRDRYGNEISLTWSLVNAFGAGTGNITRITSPNGRWIELTYYTGTPRVYQAKDNIGRTVTYAYDVNGNLTSVTDPMNHVTSYTYDASNRMTGIKPPNLQGTQLNLVSNEYTTSADAPTPIGWVKKQTHADGGVYGFTYTVVNGKSTQTDVSDPEGHVQRVTFNPAGYSLMDKRALGEVEEQTVTSERQVSGNFPTLSIDSLNRHTSQVYDDNGNLTSITRLAGTLDAVTTMYTYEPLLNQIATVTDPLMHTTTFVYDTVGNAISVTDPLNHTITMAYNGAGQVTSTTNALQHTTTYAYLNGDLVKVTNPLGFETTYFTDGIGRVQSTTDPLGNKTRFEYDAARRVIGQTDSLGSLTTFTYRPQGQLETVTDARNGLTTFNYDSMGRLSARIDPFQKAEVFTHDLVGRPQERVDRSGQLTRRSYDALGRLEQTLYADGSTITYTYDASDRTTTVTDSIYGTITRDYDDLDRLTSETTPQGSVTYTYDSAGRRQMMTVLGQPAIAYEYDDADRLTRVTQGSTVADMTYDDAGRRSTLTLPNGVIATYQYDNANQLTNLAYALGQNTLGTLTYAYDAAGRRTQVGGTWARTGLPAAVASATYDVANRLTVWSGNVRSYDPNGNLVSDGLTSYSWDARNQLVALSGAASANFQYDGLRRRAGKMIGTESSEFLFDGIDIIQELAGGMPVANLIRDQSVDELWSRVDVSGMHTTLVDSQGSTVAEVDAVGDVEAQLTYEPFGKTQFSGASPAAYQYTGRERDSNSLYYYRARYYDVETGQFLSEDPIGFQGGGPNLYSYADSDPINFTDPFGLQAKVAQDAVYYICCQKGQIGVCKGPLPSSTNRDIDNCMMQHEQQHLDDFRKNRFPCDKEKCKGAKNGEPVYTSAKTAVECSGSCAELSCLTPKFQSSDVRRRVVFVKALIGKYCGSGQCQP